VSEKWVKELRETWPLIEARIVTSPREMDEFFRQADLNPGRKWAMVIPNSRLGQGDGWRPVYTRETLIEDDQRRAWTLARYRSDGSVLWKQEGHHVVMRRPDGNVVRQIARNILLADKQYDVFKCPTCGDIATYLDKDGHPVVVTDAGWFEQTPQHCINCGGALYQDDRLTLAPALRSGASVGVRCQRDQFSLFCPSIMMAMSMCNLSSRAWWVRLCGLYHNVVCEMTADLRKHMMAGHE
jgi:hypothetical protein